MASSWFQYNFPFYFQGDVIMSFDLSAYPNSESEFYSIIYPESMPISTQMVDQKIPKYKIDYIDMPDNWTVGEYIKYSFKMKCDGSYIQTLSGSDLDVGIQSIAYYLSSQEKFIIGAYFKDFNQIGVKNITLFLPNAENPLLSSLNN